MLSTYDFSGVDSYHIAWNYADAPAKIRAHFVLLNKEGDAIDQIAVDGVVNAYVLSDRLNDNGIFLTDT
jgi:hypothetical protein